MKRVTTVVVGAGQCGLAMSRELSRRSVDHLVLERGRIGNSWHTERWDSLSLLTPNWMSGPAGHPYNGPDPDGFMPCLEFADRLKRAADSRRGAGADRYAGSLAERLRKRLPGPNRSGRVP